MKSILGVVFMVGLRMLTLSALAVWLNILSVCRTNFQRCKLACIQFEREHFVIYLFYYLFIFFFSVLFCVMYSHVAWNRISVVNRPKANLKTYLRHQRCQPITSQSTLLTVSLSRLRSCAVSCSLCTEYNFPHDCMYMFLHMSSLIIMFSSLWIHTPWDKGRGTCSEDTLSVLKWVWEPFFFFFFF